MSSVAEIENAIRKLPAGEAHAVAQWLQNYLGHQTDNLLPVQDDDVFAKWRGRGQLPAGLNTDDYLGLIRDGNGN